MSFWDRLFGRRLATNQTKKESLSIWTGVPVLGLDALASTGYGPEAGLTMLAPLGLLGLKIFPFIIIIIVFQLLMLYVSYRQTAAAYPDGGGAYVVASDNFGEKIGVWSAVMLCLDYFLNVSVGIAAGIGALVSAVPVLHKFTLPLCLLVLITLTLVNLRGIRQSGLTFIIPVILFILLMTVVLAWGLFKVWLSGGHPHALVSSPPIAPATAPLGLWIILTAFANGCSALTGIEAVSNGVPLFQKPTVRNAQITLTIIMIVLSAFLLAIGYLCSKYNIGAMSESQPGYQTTLSLLVQAISGRGVFYYITLVSIFIILIYSAQTSFTDFPRVCRLLAEDRYLPPYFANRGRRLVYSHGIIFLAITSGLLLIIFRGETFALIPLFAIGAFGAFLFSQLGMVIHWYRIRGPGYQYKLAINLLGALTTAIALVIIIAAKFLEGAWITLLLISALAILLIAIKRHYKKIARVIDQPLALQVASKQKPIVIIPIQGWDCVSEQALRFSLNLSNDITALYVSLQKDDLNLRNLWKEKVEGPAKAAGLAIPKLVIIESPYRLIETPIIKYIKKVRKDHKERIIMVVIPELVEPHWYEYVLHNLHAAFLRASVFLLRDKRIVVISVPWYLH